jgi:hypothetical protein
LEEWRYCSTHSLTSALDGDEWSASRPGCFTPRERVPVTHWIGGWVGPRAVLDAVVKRKIPSRRRESNPRTPIVQPVAQRYKDGMMFSRMMFIPNITTLSDFVQNILAGYTYPPIHTHTHTQKQTHADENNIKSLSL